MEARSHGTRMPPGPVQTDLNVRRAVIHDTSFRGNLVTVTAYVSLAKVFDYSDAVRSVSQGRANYSLEPAGFQKLQRMYAASS